MGGHSQSSEFSEPFYRAPREPRTTSPNDTESPKADLLPASWGTKQTLSEILAAAHSIRPLQAQSCSGVECGDALDDLAEPVACHSDIREDRCVAVHLCLLTGVGVGERPALHLTKRQWRP